MTLEFRVYWSFRSPYSYLATARLVRFVAEHDVDAQLRIVRPLALRDPAHFERMGPLHRPYFFRDTAREAARLGLPFRRPVPDPIQQDPVTLKIAAEQPYIRDISHLGVEACRRGRGLDYADRVSKLLWDGAVDDWHTGDHLARAAADAGLDHAAMRASIAADPEACDRELVRNETELEAAGHWGVPCFVFEGEPFFGQDRFDTFVWRLRQHGLRERPGSADGTSDSTAAAVGR